jgi:hypothetical protein
MKSTAADVRVQILRSRDKFWRVTDFDAKPHAVVMELRRLVDAGELERVRRGVYWRGRKSRFGRDVPAAVQALREVVGVGEAVGAAGWYATNLLGLSTQVAPQPVVSTTRRPPTGLRGVRVISRASRIGRRDARLNDIEVTLLEALEGWDKYVELEKTKALGRFVELLRQPDVRLNRILRAAVTESPVVRERLRAVLQHGGWREAASRIMRARSRTSSARALRVIPDVS